MVCIIKLPKNKEIKIIKYEEFLKIVEELPHIWAVKCEGNDIDTVKIRSELLDIASASGAVVHYKDGYFGPINEWVEEEDI